MPRKGRYRPSCLPPPPRLDAALAKAKADHKGDNTNTVEVLVSVGPYPAQLEYRTRHHRTQRAQGPGRADLCDGWRLHAGNRRHAGQRQGKSGAQHVRHIHPGRVIAQGAKGDYIMVPPDTPHWYTQVQGRFVSITLHMPMTAQ